MSQPLLPLAMAALSASCSPLGAQDQAEAQDLTLEACVELSRTLRPREGAARGWMPDGDHYLSTGSVGEDDSRIAVVVSAADGAQRALYIPAQFRAAFEAKGGEIVDAVRMPLSTTDFTPFLQRVHDLAPDAVFTFLPGGPPTFTYTKTYNENGLREAGIKFLGTAETEESNLQSLGDLAIGLSTAYHYSAAHSSDMNRAFLDKLQELHPDAVANWASIGAYDGVHLIYQMVEAAGSDGPAAVQAALGLEWESPRGPVSMDPETRTVIQNVYIREVERNVETGLLENAEKGVIATVGDLGWDK